MEHKAHYWLVFSFLLGVVAIAAMLWLWIADTSRPMNSNRYLLLFNESVSSLSVGADVSYLGVKVGNVASIGLDPKYIDQVKVEIDVEPDTPILKGTYAKLDSLGLTGVGFISLIVNDEVPNKLEPKDDGNIIPTVPSALGAIFDAAPAMIAEIKKVAEEMQKFLSDENARAVTASLNNVESLTAEVGSLARELRDSNQHLKSFLKTVDEGSPELLAKLDDTAQNLSDLTNRLDQIIIRNEPALDQIANNTATITEDVAREAGSLMVELRETAADIGRLVKRLERQPSSILVNQEPTRIELRP